VFAVTGGKSGNVDRQLIGVSAETGPVDEDI